MQPPTHTHSLSLSHMLRICLLCSLSYNLCFFQYHKTSNTYNPLTMLPNPKFNEVSYIFLKKYDIIQEYKPRPDCEKNKLLRVYRKALDVRKHG